MRTWLLSEINYGHVQQHHYEVVVLPMGATEPHNLHLPYGTDTFEADAIAGRACELATSRGARVLQLPTIPYGTETNMSKFPFAMNLLPSTVGLVVRDLIHSLEPHGIQKVVILNSHGGNDFKPLLRELAPETNVRLFLCDWFRGLVSDLVPEIFTHREDHAGEVETSLGLACFPHLVARDPETQKLAADAGSVRLSRFDAVNRGWVTLSRPWHLLTTNSGSGNPHAATREKGERLLREMTERLAQFLVELDAAPVDELFPFQE